MLSKPRVLVADSDPGVCRLLRRYFAGATYVVLTAGTGREALALVKRVSPHVAIVSTGLGDIGGIELIQCIRSVCSAPIIVLIHPGSTLTAAQVLDSGADDCVGEPFYVEELAARTRRLLKRMATWQ
jgi:DNA-binding response OmpR family regulator